MKLATPVALSFLLSLGLLSLACEEEKPPEPQVEKKAAEPEAPEPVVESPPHFVVSDGTISVRSTTVEGAKKTGIIETVHFDKLKTALGDEKKFIDGKEITVIVDRKAKRGWVAAYLQELGALGVAKITVKTETRDEFPKELTFLPTGKGENVPKCSLVGQVTEHNGSALWNVKGGTAKSRGPGLGGPDLSMAKENISANYKKCESDTFLTDGANEKDWGFIYDMAAAAVSTEEAGVTQAYLTPEPQTAGRPVKLVN